MTNLASRGAPPRRCWRACCVLVPLLAFLAGCPLPTTPGDGTDTGTTPILDSPGNGTVASATALPLLPTDNLSFRGAIGTSEDIDVYQLGFLAPGDRLFVDVKAVSGNLDPVAAIFDNREYLVAFNDDRVPDSSDLNPQIDIIMRGDEQLYYLGIIAYPDSVTSGEYEVVVQVTRNVGVPSPQAQVVYLNWAGGNNVTVPNVGTFDLAPFSATDVGLAASQTQMLKDRVQQIVEDRYSEFNFEVLNSDDDAEPTEPHVVVHFGGDNPRAFAISEKIDTFNADPGDETIVFTESFRGAFGGQPTFEQMAQALGNTVAHEIGHLLGLVHTSECDSLMDSTCANARLLSPQSFMTAPLDTTVFPFGWQPAEEILSWVLGVLGLQPA